MGKKSLTASERRGMIVVAALALLITAGGFLASRCNRVAATPSPEEVRIMLLNDSVNAAKEAARDSALRERRKAERKDSLKRKRENSRKRQKSIYRQRMQLDETV